MVNLNVIARPAILSDQGRIANLLYFESHVHRHLDWRSPLDWLGAPEYWVAEQKGNLTAVLACPPDPPGIAWIRLFAHAGTIAPQEAWHALWQAACQHSTRHLTIAAITLQPWFEKLLKESGFQLHQNIVILEHNLLEKLVPIHTSQASLRPMTSHDLPAVAQIDNQAFESLWQNSASSLEMAFAQAGHATIIEAQPGQPLAYQISTKNPFGVHLARLAVSPSAQGQGYGRILIQDLLYQAQKQGYHRITVNTQSNNQASLALYHQQGFQLTGEQYPVYLFGSQTSS